MRPWFFISVLVLSTLNNTVMGSFRNNPIKENVVFLMGKIEIKETVYAIFLEKIIKLILPRNSSIF